jgi:hypothetical protein
VSWRRIVVAVLVVLMLGGGAAVAAHAWLGSDDARHRLEIVLTRALHRDVTIAALDVETSRGAIELRGVVVGNPEGWEGPPTLQADRVRFDVDLEDALEGRLDGKVAASGLQLWIAKRDGATNLHGMVRQREPIDLNLDIALTDAHVLLEDLDREEQLQLDGVALSVLLSNREAVKDIALDLDVAALTVRGVGLQALEIEAVGSNEAVELRRVVARVGEQGRVEGAGSVQLDDATTWAIDLTATAVALDDDLLPIVVAFYPPAAGIAKAPEGRTQGSLDGTLRLEGAGTQWAAMKPTLKGNGAVTLRDIVLPEQSLAVSIGALVGRELEPWVLGTTTVDVQIGEGWVTLLRVVNDGAEVMPPVTGRVGLDGALDLEVDLMPLVRVYGGGVYARVVRTTSSIPLRVQGTVEQPDFEPPTPGAVAKGLLGGLVHRALGE